jgi:hypothetical protein
LELPQGPGPGPGGEPALEGLVEPFHLAAGLGVVGRECRNRIPRRCRVISRATRPWPRERPVNTAPCR